MQEKSRVTINMAADLVLLHGLLGCRFSVGIRKRSPKKGDLICTCFHGDSVNMVVPLEEAEEGQVNCRGGGFEQGFEFCFDKMIHQLVVKLQVSEHWGSSDVVRQLVGEREQEGKDPSEGISVGTCFFMMDYCSV